MNADAPAFSAGTRSRRLIPFLAATAAALAAAAPAYAENTLVQNASAHNAGNVASSTITDIWGRCTAAASPGARTKILECFLHGKSTGTIYTGAGSPPIPEGPVAWASKLWEGIPMEPFELCVRSTATFADGETITLPRECVTT